MEIKEVKQLGWDSDLLRIELAIGNICNYKCWYCFPGSNEGNLKWPEFDVIVSNLSYLLNYYLKNTNKKRFDFHVLGGEITHWKQFSDFIKYFKDNYDCIFTLTTNASKKMDWWKKIYKQLDYVMISVHNEYSDPLHIREVADFLYEKNVYVVTLVLMDPFKWDKCIDIANTLSASKYKWTIRYSEIIHEFVNYSKEQKNILEKERHRKGGFFYFLKTNKSYKSKVKVIDTSGKKHSLKDNAILLKRLNNFKDWNCNVGVDWISIKADGTVSGICGNGLYKEGLTYNILKTDFKEKFNPEIKTTICKQSSCWCMFEANMSKRKIIPIYEN